MITVERAEQIHSQRTDVQFNSMESLIDRRITAAYVPGKRLEIDLVETYLPEDVFQRLVEKYATGGWNLSKGWAGTRELGHLTLLLVKQST